MNAARIGIAVFALAVLAGPLYTVPEYSVVRNLVSELGAQSTPRSGVMILAFVVLGAGIVWDGLRARLAAALPFVAFGGFMALAGLFGHRPIDPAAPFVPWVHAAHSGLATAAGFALTVGFVWQAVRDVRPARRALAAALAVTCVALPLAMLAWPSVQGLIQRAMYAMVFAWLWVAFPHDLRS